MKCGEPCFECQRGLHSLMYAAHKKQKIALRKLIELGGDLKLQASRSVLVFSMHNFISMQLQYNITDVFQDKRTVLIVAAKIGASEIVEMLLTEFKDRLGDDGINQVDEVIRLLLGLLLAWIITYSYYCYSYACVLPCVLQRGWSSMHHAAHGGHMDALRVLLEHGADFNLKAKVTPMLFYSIFLVGSYYFGSFVYFL